MASCELPGFCVNSSLFLNPKPQTKTPECLRSASYIPTNTEISKHIFIYIYMPQSTMILTLGTLREQQKKVPRCRESLHSSSSLISVGRPVHSSPRCSGISLGLKETHLTRLPSVILHDTTIHLHTNSEPKAYMFCGYLITL